MKIGLLIIATGKYISFAKQFSDSARSFFLKNTPHDVTIFVFTDSATVPPGTVKLYKEHKKFPHPTLTRYHTFVNYSKELSKMDYLFYADVDMKFVDFVGEEILGKLTATQHPGYYNKSPQNFPYERRKKSTAQIPKSVGQYYFCGGFNGGKTGEFLKIAKEIARDIDLDQKKNIIAIWHDESHLNHYLLRHPPETILSPAYCFPQNSKLPIEPKILALEKDHDSFRYLGLEWAFNQAKTAALKKLITPLVQARDQSADYKKLLFRLTSGLFESDFEHTTHFNAEQELEQKNKIDLVTIAFNNSSVIEIQTRLLKRNLIDNYSYTVVDNSTMQSESDAISTICKKYGTGYIRLKNSNYSFDPSLSHGLAIDWAYRNFIKRRNANSFGFLDHDIFPVKKTSLIKNLEKFPVFGLPQQRGNKWYLWAGFCFFNKSKLPRVNFNFLPADGLDTGGGNWLHLFSKLDKVNLPKIKHQYGKLENKSEKGFTLLPNSEQSTRMSAQLVATDVLIEFMGDWLHTFNGSNWREKKNKNRKITKLLVNF